MKILHTSDWHLGRQLHQVSLQDDQRHVLQQIVALAIAEQVDVVVVAGDIYDRAVPPAHAVTLLNETLQALHEAQIDVILISGNHDSAQRLGFAAKPLAKSRIHVMTELTEAFSPVCLADEWGDVAFYAVPYVDPALVQQLLETPCASHDDAMSAIIDKIQSQPLPARRVLISHCFVDGGASSESERPLSLGGAECVNPAYFSDFNYVALGHLHGRQFKHQEHIRYSGSILKYSFSEAKQIKSVTLVDMDAAGNCETRQLPLTPLRDLRIIEGALTDLCQPSNMTETKDDYLLVRLTDTQAILDVMGKLRAVYPNVLHIERPGLQLPEQTNARKALLHKGELAMFADFYQEVSGQALSDEQQVFMQQLISGLHHEDDECSP